MLAWRIADRSNALDRSGEAARTGGRWNREGLAAVYASSTVDLAQREAQQARSTMKDPVLVRITLPDDAELLQRFAPNELPAGWAATPPTAVSQEFGSRLLERNDALSLMLPSALLPAAFNVIVNPNHPAYAQVRFDIDDEQAKRSNPPTAAQSHEERNIDEAVEMTFPASDPIAPKERKF